MTICTVKEAANELHLNSRTIYGMIHSKKIWHRRNDQTFDVNIEEIKALLQARKEKKMVKVSDAVTMVPVTVEHVPVLNYGKVWDLADGKIQSLRQQQEAVAQQMEKLSEQHLAIEKQIEEIERAAQILLEAEQAAEYLRKLAE